MSWTKDLSDDQLEPFRLHGRGITKSLLCFIDATTSAERESALEQAARSATECGRAAAGCGVGMSDTVEAFLRCRLPFLRELGALARRRGLDTAEATELLESATVAIDRLLSSLMSGQTNVTTKPDIAERTAL